MAKASAPAAPDKPKVLPLPAPVLQHHVGTGTHGVSAIMKEWASQGHVPPVLLITGIAGVGKRSIAHYLAQWILCEKGPFARSSAPGDGDSADLFGGGLFGESAPAVPESPDATKPAQAEARLAPCEECANCHRAQHGNWLDFTEILPADEESETLKIDQFRDLKATQGFGAHESAYKIILIPNSDRMTPQAANSMLKILEEPPAHWIFFLTASDPTLLLPTIVSRCQTLRLKPFPTPVIAQLLSEAGVPAARREICAELAQGSWGKAFSLAEEGMWDHRRAIFDFIRDPVSGITPLVDWAGSEPRGFDLLLDQLEQVTADLLKWSVTGAPAETHAWRNSDGKPALVHHATTLAKKLGIGGARGFWLERAQRVAQARQELLAPLNRKILVQDVLLPWLGTGPEQSPGQTR